MTSEGRCPARRERAGCARDAFGLKELRGYRQVTDAHLLAMTAVNGGRLVTFDTGLKDLGDRVGIEVELLG